MDRPPAAGPPPPLPSSNKSIDEAKKSHIVKASSADRIRVPGRPGSRIGPAVQAIAASVPGGDGAQQGETESDPGRGEGGVGVPDCRG